MKPRKNLVIVCVGDDSLHEGWFEPSRLRRAFDLVLIYYGNVPDRFRDRCEHYLSRKGSKFELLRHVLTEHVDLLSQYDAIWLPDDDIRTDAATIARMFQLFHRECLALAQPALSPESHISHGITRQKPRYLLRYTNFVEVMVPIFRRDVLLALLPTFGTNRSGWGLDYWWCQQVLDKGWGRIAILDSVPVTHTRPVTPNGGYYKAMSIDPEAELRALVSEHGLSIDQRTLGKRRRWFHFLSGPWKAWIAKSLPYR
ncbi:DUF707 domain-containing protein [Holophaga foetida]|uniref:DUF707 domain-containing protein n=1 Tax=Holophaga foetida TaxID=35839 RepID=UPI0002472EAA|nr:DUF707 domain-containing protein [Holophaga foetida]